MSGRRPAPVVTGTVRPGWEGVRDAFARGQAEDPGGAQLAVRHGGRTVADLWTPGTGRFGYGAAPDGAGSADGGGVTGSEAFRADSVGVLMSVSKALVAVCAHLLIERGILDPDDPVARH
ncbi:serine hydrolase domain-containing protein [Streptomyces rubiginosohelvolus]|uniref:serine hydrolase domain-containing protein n=1 Tax=Streptomyces rubiginosohelvolus TaxID=67362 RepID=UPI00382F100C